MQPRMRSAILFFLINLIGMGLGPWGVGLLSDMLSAELGNESLRYAMLYLLPAAMGWSAVHFLMASRTLQKDLETNSRLELVHGICSSTG